MIETPATKTRVIQVNNLIVAHQNLDFLFDENKIICNQRQTIVNNIHSQVDFKTLHQERQKIFYSTYDD